MTTSTTSSAIELLQRHSLATLVQEMLERSIVSGEFAPGRN
jgi:hypothetical protein